MSLGLSRSEDSWIRGLATEKAFAKLFRNACHSTKEQDVFEHWDFSVRFDVKSIPKNNRNLYCIELKNVRGNDGWLNGKADFIAFDTPYGHWIVVAREILLQHVKENLQHTVAYKKQYCLYSRKGRKDLMTFISREDLLKIGGKIEK